jgi:hypothetical protein
MSRPEITAHEEPKRRKRNRAEHHAELLMGLANQRGAAHAYTDDADAYSVEEFCRRHRISVQAFYKYQDEMPVTFNVGTRRLISREAAARWRAEREAESAAEAKAAKAATAEAQ